MGEVLLPNTSLTQPNVQQKCVSVPNPDGKLTRVTIENRVVNASGLELDNQDLEGFLQLLSPGDTEKNIIEINLSHNKISSDGMHDFCKHLASHFPCLVRLDVSYNPVGDSGVTFLYEAIKSRIEKRLSILTFINLTSTNISQEGARTIYSMIRKSDGALIVSFENNAINGEGIGFIFAARYWESFTINNNTLDVTFPLFLMQIRQHSYMLKELRIANNNLSPSTAQQLPQVIGSLALPSLRVLWIEERLWDEGVRSFFRSDAIVNLVNLERLSLVNTCLKVDAFVSFLQTFHEKVFPNLKEVQIKGRNGETGVRGRE